jgi:prepilin-type N-terminal cleavage/methylation domain-containing protein
VAREDGFTLTELLVVIVIVGILTAIAIGFYSGAREKAGDATARSNIRIAVPAIEAYRSDNGSYAAVTLAALQASYSPGIQGIEILSATDAGYCVRSTVSGRSWYLSGPGGATTTTACT